ncbi:unnamed protein product [Rhizophagus irregularis]|nr:unnamed protein product [Rhizophagus irregularis]
MTSSVEKGSQFESCVYNKRNYVLLALGVRASIFFSPFKEHTLLVQCKNYITTKVGINEIREFEGALIRYNKDHTLVFFVTSIENGYTTPALLHASSSGPQTILI